MRHVLCRVVGHKLRRHRRFLLLAGRLEWCERCGERVKLNWANSDRRSPAREP